jgi:hypothetical protein
MGRRGDTVPDFAHDECGVRGIGRIVCVLALCWLSSFARGVPVGTTVALVAAALVALGAVRLVVAAEILELRGHEAAVVLLRLARFCHDLMLALLVLAGLYLVHPF